MLWHPLPGPVRRAASTAYALFAVLTVAALGVLRSFHDETPRLVEGPFGSLLFVAATVLIALHLRHRRRGLDRFPPISERRGITFAMTVPLLIAVVVEKWISVELLQGAFDWTFAYDFALPVSDALYSMWTGFALIGVVLILYLILRQNGNRLRRLAAARRIPRALLLCGGAAAITATMLFAIVASVSEFGFGVSNMSTGALGLSIASQAVRSGAEELFYRGLVQACLIRLLEQAGLARGRLSRAVAIVAVSCGFALEHAGQVLPAGEAVGMAVYIFAMSCALGVLLEISRNLYVPILTHIGVNLVAGLLVPLPITPEMTLVLPPEIPVTWFLVLIFVGLALIQRARSRA